MGVFYVNSAKQGGGRASTLPSPCFLSLLHAVPVFYFVNRAQSWSSASHAGDGSARNTIAKYSPGRMSSKCTESVFLSHISSLPNWAVPSGDSGKSATREFCMSPSFARKNESVPSSPTLIRLPCPSVSVDFIIAGCTGRSLPVLLTDFAAAK